MMTVLDRDTKVRKFASRSNSGVHDNHIQQVYPALNGLYYVIYLTNLGLGSCFEPTGDRRTLSIG